MVKAMDKLQYFTIGINESSEKKRGPQNLSLANVQEWAASNHGNCKHQFPTCKHVISCAMTDVLK